jgi:hypothetical protein
MIRPCASGCEPWHKSTGGSVIAGFLIFLHREGFIVNHNRLFRIYREERLMMRKRVSRKRALGNKVAYRGSAGNRRSLVARLRL